MGRRRVGDEMIHEWFNEVKGAATWNLKHELAVAGASSGVKGYILVAKQRWDTIKCSRITIRVTMILRKCIEWPKSFPKLPSRGGCGSDQQDHFFHLK